MANFNLTRIRPKGFLHSSAFNEVIDSLAWSLTALGHSAMITENVLSAMTHTNIIFGAELIPPGTALPPDTIIYNLEQPSHPNMDNVRALARDKVVWDFSLRNVEKWRAEGYDVRHVPIGYTPNLTRIPKAKVQDIDVLFYGWLTPRRVKIINDLRAAGMNVVATDTAYGGGRDNLISRAKVVLNVHHDGRDMFEIVRVSYLLANSKCVVSEPSIDDEDYSYLRGGFSVGSFVVDACSSLLSDPALRHRFEVEGADKLESHGYTASVAAALDGPVRLNTMSDFPSGMPQIKSRVLKERYEKGCREGDMTAFLPWLRSHARGQILEIGTRDGASTSAFLLGLEENDPSGHLHSIDIQDCSGLWRHPHPQWTFTKGNSLTAQFRDAAFDLILIDGDHSLPGYIGDLYNAYHWCKPGGLILTHDIVPERGHEFYAVQLRERFFQFAKEKGLEHYELPGRYGMGVMVR
jgi:predicted O-methyltransferase YrrM